MDLTPITNAISEDAKMRVSLIAADSKRELAKMYADFEEEKKLLKSEKQQALEERIKELKRAHNAAVKKLSKDAASDARAQVLSDAEKKAKTAVLESSFYPDFLEKLYDKAGVSGEIFLNKKDLEHIGHKIFPGSKVSNTPVDIDGGFIMECADSVYNYSIDSIFEEKRQFFELSADEILKNRERDFY